MELKYLALICNNGPASQTLQEANKVARTHVYEEHIKEFDDEAEEDIFTNEESVFFTYLKKKHADLGEFKNLKEYTAFLFQEFNQAF